MSETPATTSWSPSNGWDLSVPENGQGSDAPREEVWSDDSLRQRKFSSTSERGGSLRVARQIGLCSGRKKNFMGLINNSLTTVQPGIAGASQGRSVVVKKGGRKIGCQDPGNG